MRNLISFSPPTHSIIHSSTSVLLVLSHSYNFSLSPPSSIKWLFSLTFLKNSKWGTVGFDIFCSLKLSTPYPLWYFPLTKDHFEMTSPLSFISSTHHSSFPTAVWIISTPCPRLLRHCSVKPSFKSQQKTKRWQKGKVLNQTVDLHGVLLTFFFWCLSFVYTSNSSNCWTSSCASIRERAVTGFSAGLYHLK